MGLNEATRGEASRKVNRHKLDVGSAEESDGVIGLKKSANKGAEVPAESMEERTPTKRNSVEEAANRMQSRRLASIGLGRVRQRVPMFALTPILEVVPHVRICAGGTR